MITGSHSIIYSKNAGKDRDFFRDILKFNNVDVGDGWLIFGLPPSEVAFHPHTKNDYHEFYLITDDVEKFVGAMRKKNVTCTSPADHGWGILTEVTLPGGGKIGVYQPRHKRPFESKNTKSVLKKSKKKKALKSKRITKSKR